MAKSELDFMDFPVNAQGKSAPKWQQKTPSKYSKPEGCLGCPLYDISSGFSKPEGKGTIPLLIVAEALGEAECKDGLPLRPYAPSGSVVEKAIKQLGYTREQFVLWNVVGCFPGDTLIQARGTEKAYKRWYEGPMIRVLAGTDELTGTPNHPVLTQRGWVAMGDLNQTDYLVRAGWQESNALTHPYIYNNPTKFVELFDALSESGVSQWIVGSRVDFHGDGMESEIEIVAQDGLLLNGALSSTSEKMGQLVFKSALDPASFGVMYSSGQRRFLHLLNCLLPPGGGFVSSTGKPLPSLRTFVIHPNLTGQRPIADRYAVALQGFPEPGLADPKLLGKGFDPFSCEVAFSKISNVDRFNFSGHVYNLQTMEGQYIANTFIVSNCRPPGNELEGQWYERGAIEHCRTHFDAVVERYKPGAILALGNVALSTLTGLSGKDRTVSSLRGYVLWSDRYNIPVVPTYHPSFVRRGGLKLFWVLRHDLAKAIAVARGQFKDWVICQTPRELVEKADVQYQVDASIYDLEMCAADMRVHPDRLLAYDIETDYSSRDSEEELSAEGTKITQIQFSMGKWRGLAAKWTEENLPMIEEILGMDNPQAAHNGWRFDNPMLKANGMKLNGKFDTMTMWHHYQPDLPQGLQFVSSFFGMRFPWKHMASQDIGVYGVADVDAVQHIWEKLPEVMKKKVNSETGMSVWDGYVESVVALQPILEGMQERGIGIDVEGQARLREWIQAEQARVNSELQPLIPKEIKKRKEWKTWPEDCKDFVATAKNLEEIRLKEVLIAEGKKVTKKATTVVIKVADIETHAYLKQRLIYNGYQIGAGVIYKELDFNPNSTFQLRDLLKFYKVEIPKTLDGEETTGKGELRKLLKKSKSGEIIPIISKTLEYRELGKAIGTYIDGKGWTPDAEGRVHTTFTHKSATWQLTSIEPCIQNISKHTRLGGELRKLIVPFPGNVLIEADYSSYHVLTLGFNAESQRYMDLARTDAHSYITAHMLKTRCKPDSKDELDQESLEHIKDLDNWLSLPREVFLQKLGWIKKHYGKTVRQQAKACIAEDSLVLTDKGLIPIQNITLDHRLWDGVEWVSHSGLIYQGIQEVITYDGITGTKDHEVFLEDGTTTLLGRAASRLDRLERTGVAGQAVRASHSYLRRDNKSEWIQEVVGEMHEVQHREVGRLQQHGIRAQSSRLSGMCSNYLTKLQSTWQTLRCNHSSMFSYPLESLRTLWRSWNNLQVLQPQGIYLMGGRKSTSQGLQGCRDRQDKQRWALRTGESKISHEEATARQSKEYREGNVSREIDYDGRISQPIQPNLYSTQGQTRYDWRADDRGGQTDRDQQRNQVENDSTNVRKVRVYDILNAGPRHRFTVDDKLVSNCILGVGLGLGVDKLHSHNEDSFNPNEVEAEKWLTENPKVQFYSPISRSMKPSGYFPKEMQVMLAQEKLGKQAAKEVRMLVERLFPEIFKWQQKIRQQAHRDGYLVSRYGGIRWFHNVFEWDHKRGMEVPGEDAEAAIAFFVQNDAFGKIREAMLEIERESFYGRYLVNTVHDSLVFDIPEAEVNQAALWIKEIMERPAKKLKHPSLCPEGLVCNVEISVGPNWFDLKEIKL